MEIRHQVQDFRHLLLTARCKIRDLRYSGPGVAGMSPQEVAFSCRDILREVRFAGPFAIEIARFSTPFRCQILHEMALVPSETLAL